MKHQDNVVLVTGAAQGLGLACAERFLADGAKVLLEDVQEEEVRAQAERLGNKAAWYAADLNKIGSALAKDIVGQTIYRDGGRLIINYTVPVNE